LRRPRDHSLRPVEMIGNLQRDLLEELFVLALRERPQDRRRLPAGVPILQPPIQTVPGKAASRYACDRHVRSDDKLAELAAAGDWDAVAGYQCTGINSYAKMVRQYRDRLVVAHRAQQAAATEQVTVTRTPVFTRHPISATPQFGVVLKPGDKLEATDVYDSTTGQWSACPCPGLTVQEGIAAIWIRPQAPDPRDPRPDSEMVGRDAIFRDHNCSRCRDGERPCVRGNPRNCVGRLRSGHSEMSVGAADLLRHFGCSRA
jgi:hypothetical protein